MSEQPHETASQRAWRVETPSPRRWSSKRHRNSPPDWDGEALGFNEQDEQAGVIPYEITGKKIVFGNVDFRPDMSGNLTGEDNTGQGLGSAILDAIEKRFPDHWFAEIGEDHSPEGVMFMEGRALSGRRRIHSADCTAEIKTDVCDCEIKVWPGGKELELAKLRQLRDAR